MSDFSASALDQRAIQARWVLRLAFFILVAAFFNAQILEHERYRLRSEDNRLRAVPLTPPRGPILDRFGRIIAENVPGYSVKLLAPDGFAQQSTIDLAGPASRGMFASVPGRVPQNLSGPGRKLVSELRKEVGGAVELYAPYAGQAAAVLLDWFGWMKEGCVIAWSGD
jgi:hypothetical protein